MTRQETHQRSSRPANGRRSPVVGLSRIANAGGWHRIVALALAATICACSSPEQRPEPTTGYSSSGRYLLQGDELLRGGERTAAAAAYQRSVDEAVRERNNSNLVEALAQLAEVSRLERDENGESWLLGAQDRAEATEPLGWSRLLRVEGLFALDQGRVADAQASFGQLFDYCVEHELYDRAMDAAHRLALSGALEHRASWSERGIALAAELGDERWQAVLWNNLGWAYNDAHQPEEALDAFLQARELYAGFGSAENRLVADYSVGRAYRVLGDVERAIEWLGPTHRWAEDRYRRDASPNNARWLGLTQLELAEMAADLGAGRETVTSLQRAHTLLVESGAEEWWPEGLRRIEERLTVMLP